MSGRKIIGTIISVSLEIIVVALVVMVLYKYGQEAYNFGYSIFSEETIDEEPGIDKVLTIVDGYSDMDIAQLLKTKHLIKDEKVFWIQMKVFNYSGDIKPGDYTLNTSMTPEEMVAVLTMQEDESEEEE